MRLPRIHRSTLIVALGTVVPLAMLNVPGEFVSPLGPAVSPFFVAVGSSAGGGGGASTYTAEYIHGWPWLSLYREVVYDLTPGTTARPDIPKYGVPWMAWTSWKFWQGETWELRLGALFGDALTSLFMIITVASVWEWRRRRRAHALQFTLAECLVAFVVVAAPFGWWWHAKSVSKWEDALAESIDHSLQHAQQEYHGPLWVRRLAGKDLLSPAFMRVDSAAIVVEDDKGFLATVPVLRKFAYLRELSLEKTRDDSFIPYSKLAGLTNLRYLTLDHIVLDEDGVSELGDLRQLLEIDITDWQWQKPEIMQRLLGALPNCHISEEPIYYPQSFDGTDRFTR